MQTDKPIDIMAQILQGPGRVICSRLRANVGSGECQMRRDLAMEELANPRSFFYRHTIVRPTALPADYMFCLKCPQNKNLEKSVNPDS